MSEKGPPVNGVHADGHSREPSCHTAKRRRLRAVDVNDLRPPEAQEPKQLQEAKDVSPWVDGTPDVPERDELRAGDPRRVPQRAVSTCRDDHVEIAGERFEQRGDVRLCASGFGQRDEENDSRARGRVVWA
jgi:hypothetical protein